MSMKTITQKIREEIIVSSFSCFVAGVVFSVGLSELSRSEYSIGILITALGVMMFAMFWKYIKDALKNLKYCAVV